MFRIFFGFILIMYAVACKDTTPDLKTKQQSKTQVKESEIIQEMSTKYNAVVVLRDGLAMDGLGRFTINAQNALIRADNRPILLSADLLDIEKSTDEYLIRFKTFSSDIRLILKCDAEKTNKLIAEDPKYYSSYIIVAHITSVRKPSFAVSADEFSEIYLSDNNMLIVEGNCIDFRKVSDLLE